MSFTIECPGCLTPHTLPDEQRGKPHRCETCLQTFVAEAVAEEAPRIVQPVDAVAAEAPKMNQLIDEEPYVAMPVDRKTFSRGRAAGRGPEPSRKPTGKKKLGGERVALLVTALIAVLMVGGAAAAIGYRVWLDSGKKQVQNTGKTVVQVPRPRGVVVQPETQRIGLDCEDREVQEVYFSDQATRQAAVVRTSLNGALWVDRYDLAAGKRLSSFNVNAWAAALRMSLSPSGTRFAYEDNRGDVVIVSAQDGRVAARWRPYVPNRFAAPGDLPFEHALARIEFVTEDRLLTVNQAGGMDLWTVPGLQPVYHVAGKPGREFSDPRVGLGLSLERKTLAVFNQDGFELRDTMTGALQRETVRPAKFNTVDSAGGVAFSPNGKTVVAMLTIRRGGKETDVVLAGWEVATGRFISDIAVEKGQIIQFRSQLIWWGPNHVVARAGSPKEGLAVSWPGGQQVRQLEAGYRQKNGLIAPNSPDGRLWFVAGTEDSTAAFLTTVDMPENERRIEGDLPGERWWLTAKGIFK